MYEYRPTEMASLLVRMPRFALSTPMESGSPVPPKATGTAYDSYINTIAW